ncbi:MAG: metal ABC transporter permease [Propionibacteriaceae bacterium]|nr:metal ABC transporter permease [Propionibacteriaceae bacterium]
MDYLALAFVQRALVAAAVVGVSAPSIGTYIVQRRLSLLGDGLGHVAIAGVGFALLTGTAPVGWAIGICVAGAIGIETLRQRGKATGDIGLAILFYGGLAAGVLMASMAGQGAAGLAGYLFGSLNTLTTQDLWIVGVLSLLILLVALGLMPQFFTISADEDFARTLGLPVRLYNYLIVIVAAIAVTIAMRTVGLLLVSALMVIPVSASQNLFTGFKRGMWGAMGIGLISSVGGYLIALYADLAPGAMIVLVTIGFFIASLPISALVHRHVHRARDEDPRPDPHTHTEVHDHIHGPDCGHPAVRHGDHLDYIHDGHLHAPHGEHYDEH